MDAVSRALAAYDICGCCAAISVLDRQHPEDAYRMAAEESRAGMRIENVDVDEWKAAPMYCPDHPKGPPWWQRNGPRRPKRPTQWPPPKPVFGQP